MSYVIEQELCSGCHRCRVECPVEAIRFLNAKYYIDPEKCISCGHCAEVCHNNVISNPEEKKEIKEHDLIELEADVVVIGAGGAGMTAAERARDLGKKVLVLEKNKEVGGSAWYAHVFRNLYSKWHQEAGIPDEREKVYAEFMERTENKVNGELVKRIFKANEDFVDWMIEEHDLGKDYKFDRLFWGGMGPLANYDEPYNHQRIDTTIGPGGTGWYMTTHLRDSFLKAGGEIYYNTRATRLLLDENGEISGVEAEDEGGKLLVHTKRVIVAAGAFSRNKEMTNQFNPLFYSDDPENEPVHVFTCASCTGDGISMCREIGADIDYENCRAGMFGPMRHPFGTASLTAGRSRYGIQVNKNGDVFDKFTFGQVVSDLAYEPGRILWKIMDEASVAREMKEAQGKPEDVPGCNMDPFFVNWKEDFDKEISWGALYKADTIGELCKQINLPEEKVKEAIAKYNTTCGKVEVMDTPFGRFEAPAKDPITEEGPFYAIMMKLFHENAIGGMTIDEKLRVLKDGKPIPGLYAAGDNTRGIMVPGKVGVDYVESVISALTFALSSGFAAGEEAAK